MTNNLITHSLLVFFVSGLFSCEDPNSISDRSIQETGTNYPVYGGNKAGNRYSPLKQINKTNVTNLEVAWMYNAKKPIDPENPGSRWTRQIQCQPIVVDEVLFGTTPELHLFALHAGTGKELWKFDPNNKNVNVSRGVTYWQDGKDRRILYTVGSKLYAVDANNGKGIPDFGENGMADLHEGLSTNRKGDTDSLSVKATSPGVVYKNTFVIGSSVSESGDAAPGHIRAFDVVTGKLKWVFHTVPHPGEEGYDTWPKDAYKEVGGANSWAGMVLDEKRGEVYFGTGSPSSDFYGGNREGKNLFANCIIALEAETGKLKWYYQTVYHDVWDRDLPIQPNLTTIELNGEQVDVVVQTTKDGLVYVLNRDTGQSVFPVEERPVPGNGLPGEELWPVQKFPLKPAPFSRQVYTADDISDISPKSKAYTKEAFEKFDTDHKFTPPSKEGSLLFGYSGGAEWGGNAIDPDGILYQNANDNPWVLQMIDSSSRNQKFASLSYGNTLYAKNCASCHGLDRKGSGTEFPNITNIGERFQKEQVAEILKLGVGRMPSFQYLSPKERAGIVEFLFNPNSGGSKSKVVGEFGDQMLKETHENFGFEPAYLIKVWEKFTDPDGYPGLKPPWGTLNAIDINTGEYLWRIRLGEYPELTEKGIPITGTESYGGPLVTAGGLVFIAGTKDERIRAFDKNTGETVWEYQLPAGGFATPITYEVDGKQFIVIAAGGERGQKPGGNYIAFALPD